MIYDNEYNMFESDEEDAGLIGSVNFNVVSKYIALYFQSPTTFFVLLRKMTSNLVMSGSPIKKCAIEYEGMETGKYRNIGEYKTYEDIIQQPIDKTKTNYDNHVDTS